MKQSQLVFCDECGTLVDSPKGDDDVVECHCCHYQIQAKLFESIEVVTTSRPSAFTNRPTLKNYQEEDHQGATIQEKCPKCDHFEMIFHTAQLRSADEGQTVFYNCAKCGYKYSINS